MKKIILTLIQVLAALLVIFWMFVFYSLLQDGTDVRQSDVITLITFYIPPFITGLICGIAIVANGLKKSSDKPIAFHQEQEKTSISSTECE